MLTAGCQTADVLTYHNDNARTGLNPLENTLNPGNVNSTDFHWMFEQTVLGAVYAQTLFKSSLKMALDGNKHNVIFVATTSNIVYAFDADNNQGANANPLWTNNLNGAGSPILATDAGEMVGNDPVLKNCNNISPIIGIVGTPVIDAQTSLMYLVTQTREVNNTAGTVDFVQTLHVLAISSGAEQMNTEIARMTYPLPAPGAPTLEPGTYVRGPVVAGSGEGQGTGANTGKVIFNALRESQRAGLVLVKNSGNGVVYVSWTSHCDCAPAHGWVVGFDAKTLAVLSVFNTTPAATSQNFPTVQTYPGTPLAYGGVWQSGAAPAADANGGLYLATGNGGFDTTFDPTSGLPVSGDFGDSVLNLISDTSTAANPNLNGWGLKADKFFTPKDQATLQTKDIDLGSGGVMLLPDQTAPPLALQAGKNGSIYLLNLQDKNTFGQFDPAANNVADEVSPAFGTQHNGYYSGWTNNGIYGVPAYFNQTAYFLAEHNPVESRQIANGKLQPPKLGSTSDKFGRGGTPSISANGKTKGIVWGVQVDNYYGPNGTILPPSDKAVLYAFNADDLTLLYDSEMAAGNADRPHGRGIEFTVPTVANGKVYFGTDSTVVVYGGPVNHCPFWWLHYQKPERIPPFLIPLPDPPSDYTLPGGPETGAAP